jgi:hypothetical protein
MKKTILILTSLFLAQTVFAHGTVEEVTSHPRSSGSNVDPRTSQPRPTHYVGKGPVYTTNSGSNVDQEKYVQVVNSQGQPQNMRLSELCH